MNIYTLTFHNVLNYGAVLQTYALIEKIKEEGCENACVYNYRNENLVSAYKLLKKTNSVKGMLFQFLSVPLKIIKRSKFKAFTHKHIPIAENISEKDLFIVGSDQVWNYRASNFDKTYFLDFVKNKGCRNSYAASFGFSEIPSDLKDEYKALLSDFDNISVREKTGKNIICNLLDKEVPVVLDPIFLIDKKKWGKIAGVRQDKYILLYLMSRTDSIISFAKKLSEKTGLKIYYISDYFISRDKKFIAKRGVGPVEWLNLMYNASYVVTNSFHGTAFSICFNKEFYIELLPDGFDVNSRLTDVLDIFGLNKRIYNEKTLDELECIDYNHVNKVLQQKIQESVDYLRDVLKKEKSVGNE